MADAFEFYSRPDYFDDLLKRIAKTTAGERVAVASMKFRPSALQVDKLMRELIAAAKRGVIVDLAIDAYSFLIGETIRPGPLMIYGRLPQRLPATFQKQMEALEKLSASGGRYSLINLPSRRLTVPFAGRCHLKYAVVNKHIYLGSCNLGLSNKLDMMVGWDNQKAADWLYDLGQNINRQGNTRMIAKGSDIVHEVDETNKLMFDCGEPRQSVIFKEAINIIDKAKETIYLACQYFPNSTTLKHLVAAHNRGVKVIIVFNHPAKHKLPFSMLHHLVLLHAKTQSPQSMRSNRLHKELPFLHAKLLATEHATIIGSHNFVQAGVNFGTAEIALLNHNPAFAKQAINNLESQFKSY